MKNQEGILGKLVMCVVRVKPDCGIRADRMYSDSGSGYTRIHGLV